MSVTQTNSMAAMLSLLVRVVFWLSVILGTLSFILVGMGVIGSLNGGVVELPLVQADTVNAAPGQLVATMVGIVVLAVGVAYVCSQLRRILSTLAEGDPFVPENAPRLLRIAITIGLMEVLRYGVLIILPRLVDLGAGYEPRLAPSFIVWGSVVVLLVLSQVFREGSRLREEEKMTI